MKLNTETEQALSTFTGFFNDILDLGETYRKQSTDLAEQYLKGDFVVVGEYLTCQLILEHLVERDLRRAGLPESQLKKLRDSASRINALTRGTHLLARYKNLFHEIRLVRNKYAHELHYAVGQSDLTLTRRWYKKRFEDSRNHKDVLHEVKALVKWCLMTMEWGEDPHRVLSKRFKYAFARRKVLHRQKKRETIDGKK